MDALEEMANIMYLVVFLAVIFACVVHNNSESKKTSGDLNATGTSHHTYLKVTAPTHKKPNILECFLNSTKYMLGLMIIISALSTLYFFLMTWKELGLEPLLFLLITWLFTPCAVLAYPLISTVWFFVTMIILDIMKKEIPAGTIYRTAVYASAPMFLVNFFTFLTYPLSTFIYTFFYIGIAVTAGLMFFSIRHILKEQESECIYMSIAIRQHIRQHGFMHAAF